jgi:hypothetical protein
MLTVILKFAVWSLWLLWVLAFTGLFASLWNNPDAAEAIMAVITPTWPLIALAGIITAIATIALLMLDQEPIQ